MSSIQPTISDEQLMNQLHQHLNEAKSRGLVIDAGLLEPADVQTESTFLSNLSEEEFVSLVQQFHQHKDYSYITEDTADELTERYHQMKNES